jgi:hypothetical protein
MHSGIAIVAAPWIRPHGARNAATHHFFSTLLDGPFRFGWTSREGLKYLG